MKWEEVKEGRQSWCISVHCLGICLGKLIRPTKTSGNMAEIRNRYLQKISLPAQRPPLLWLVPYSMSDEK
jgi:hypothetical protein